MPWSRAQVGPSPGVQGELKELLRKLGRFSCYQGNLWKLLCTGRILARDSLDGFLGYGTLSCQARDLLDGSVYNVPGPSSWL